MLTRRTHLIYMMLAAASAGHAQSADPGGWTAAKWGMTEDQVVNAFPAGQVTHFATPDKYNRAQFGIEEMDISGTPFKVYMTAKDGKLDRVLLSPIKGAATDLTFQSLEQLLVEKYGHPWKTEESGITELQWTFKTTVIVLSRGKLPGTDRRIVNVQYRQKSADADKM